MSFFAAEEVTGTFRLVFEASSVASGVTKTYRTGDEADLTASFALDVPEGKRHFTMRIHLTKVDDVWFLRL